MLASLVALVATAAAAPVHAGATPLAGFGEYGWGPYSIHGDLADELGGGGLRWHLGAGLLVDRLRVDAAVELFSVASRDPGRHGDELFGAALGGDLRYYVGGDTGLRPYGRLGHRWLWLDSSAAVTRYCDDTGACDGGFWTESPSYSGMMLRVGGGLEYLVAPTARNGLLIALSIDAGYDRWAIDVVERRRSADVTSVTFGITVGGGRITSRRFPSGAQ